MDDNLKQQLSELLALLLNSAKDGAMWAKGEIPLLIQEKLTYGLASSLFAIVLCAVLFTAAVYTFCWGWRKTNEEGYYGDMGVVMMVLSATFGIPVLICFIIEAQGVLKIWLAPRLYIVEWLSGLVTGK